MKAGSLPSDSPAEAKRLSDFFVSFDIDMPAQKIARDAVVQWCQDYTINNKPGAIVLYSNKYGVGKTHLAKCAESVFRYLYKGGQFFTAPDFLEIIKASYSDDNKLNERDLFRQWRGGWFILDDFGKQYSTGAEWEQEKWFKLLDNLYEKQPLMITSNLDASKMAVRLGGAAWSRLVGLCGEDRFINMDNLPDRRLKGKTK